jgi:RNA polymerase I-specific transcription initiation factor RRN3
VIRWYGKGISSGIDLGTIRLSPESWSRLCTHRLKPLKHCLESVRNEFLHISALFELLAPADIAAVEAGLDAGPAGRSRPASPIQTTATLEAKRRKGGVGGLGKGQNPLDSFFPFDPYLLRRSHPLVARYYRNWDGSLGRGLGDAQYDGGRGGDEEVRSEDGESDADPGDLDSDLDAGSGSDGESDATSRSAGSFKPMTVSYGAPPGAWMGGEDVDGDAREEGEGGEGLESLQAKAERRRRKRADSVASQGSW